MRLKRAPGQWGVVPSWQRCQWTMFLNVQMVDEILERRRMERWPVKMSDREI